MHRLRGNACLALCRAGLGDEDVAYILAWSVKDVATLRRIYIDQNEIVHEQARRLDDAKSTSGRKPLQTGPDPT